MSSGDVLINRKRWLELSTELRKSLESLGRSERFEVSRKTVKSLGFDCSGPVKRQQLGRSKVFGRLAGLVELAAPADSATSESDNRPLLHFDPCYLVEMVVEETGTAS